MTRKSFVFMVAGTVVRTVWCIPMILFLCSVSSAVVPDKINYQGKLTTAQGGCLNATVSMTFSIYPDTLGSPSVWTETQTQVSVENGIFSVLLGSVNPIPDTVFDGSTKYLGVQVESDPEMRPLKPMVSTSYAFHSHRSQEADTAGYARAAPAIPDDDWVVSGDDIYREEGNVGIGMTEPSDKLDVNGAIRIGMTSNANPGAIRWTGTDFEGHTDTEWRSLTAGSVDTSGVRVIQTVEHSYGSGWTIDVDLTDYIDCPLLFVGHGRVNWHTTSPLKLQVWDGSTYIDASYGDGYFVPGDKNRIWCFHIHFRFKKPFDQSGSMTIFASWTGTYTGFGSWDGTFDTGQYGAMWTKMGPHPSEAKIRISAGDNTEIHFHIITEGGEL